MTIFHVNSNLRYNGDNFNKGSFIDGDLSTFGSLVSDGVLSVVEGATSTEDAKRIYAEKQAEAGTQAASEVKEPENTWGAKPDPVEEKVETTTPPAPEAEKVDGEPTIPVVAPGEAGTGDLPPNAGDNL